MRARTLVWVVLAILTAAQPAIAQRRSGGSSRSSHSSGTRSYRSTYRPPRPHLYQAPKTHTYRAPKARTYRPSKAHTYRRPKAHTYRPPKAHTYRPPKAHTYRPPKAHTYRPPRTHTYRPPRIKAPAGTTGTRDSRGRIRRNESAKRDFMRATGYPRGRPGYVVDHIVPLACGGADAPSNMQWQSAAAAKAKDRVERRGCARR